MKEQTKEIIEKHFCIETMDVPDNEIYFMPQKEKNQILVIELLDKFLVSCDYNSRELLKNCKTLQDVIKKYKKRTSSINSKEYYFIDSDVKIKRKSKKNLEYYFIKDELKVDFKNFIGQCDNMDFDKAYISLDDVDVCGVYEKKDLKAVASLIKLDDCYDLAVLTKKDSRKCGYGKNLMYNYLKLESYDKVIRFIVDNDNEYMKKLCDSLGLVPTASYTEIYLNK